MTYFCLVCYYVYPLVSSLCIEGEGAPVYRFAQEKKPRQTRAMGPMHHYTPSLFQEVTAVYFLLSPVAR